MTCSPFIKEVWEALQRFRSQMLTMGEQLTTVEAMESLMMSKADTDHSHIIAGQEVLH